MTERNETTVAEWFTNLVGHPPGEGHRELLENVTLREAHAFAEAVPKSTGATGPRASTLGLLRTAGQSGAAQARVKRKGKTSMGKTLRDLLDRTGVQTKQEREESALEELHEALGGAPEREPLEDGAAEVLGGSQEVGDAALEEADQVLGI